MGARQILTRRLVARLIGERAVISSRASAANRRRPVTSHSGRFLLAACALAAGCASTQKPPPDLDLSQAVIAVDTDQPAEIDGRVSSGGAIAIGAAGGMGAGALVATLACLGAGLLYPLCMVTVVPASMVAGTFGGAVVGGMVSDAGGDTETDSQLLRSEFASGSYPALLAQQVQERARERFSIDIPVVAEQAPLPNGSPRVLDVGGRTWSIELGLTRVSCGITAPGKALIVRVDARIRVSHGDQLVAVREASAMGTSESALASEGRAAADAGAVRNALSQGLRVLADTLLNELVPGGAVPAPPARTDG